ncbi:MAG: DEAD/DEAH box helicase [Spirulinaceae cyanobacterium]
MNSSANNSALDLKTLFPFELDDFQKRAITALNENKSVVVCAPTGSGKTLIGEYAIYRALSSGKRVLYTTPLKALSNQKLRDFRKQFGEREVGLLTGDVSSNREASVLVMTTEIFRNMLYGTPIGQVGTSLEDVEAVVLDECHYMNDRQRGTVWEESIIYCPPEIQLVALSATIANGAELTEWIAQVHGPTELINSDFRPVPLKFYFSSQKGLFDLLDKQQKSLNPRLKSKKKGGQKRLRREDCPSVFQIVSQLYKREMLPAIYFIFSRRGCDRSVEDFREVSLVNQEEASRLKVRIDEFLNKNPDAGRKGQVDALYRGIAAHHAGILPAWKGLVEELFQAGLVKAVFATETLAAGINMPARTTVISSISKRTDRGHRLLTASEFLQMAGRAGRRGMDNVGYVVTCQTPFEGAKESAYLATRKADPLVSQFTPTYGMVLNLLQTHTIDQVQNLLERSFAQYIATLRLTPQQKAIADIATELARLDVELAPVEVNLISSYEKLKARLKEERRLLKTLKQQAEVERLKGVTFIASKLEPGQIVYLKGKHLKVTKPVTAILIAKAIGGGQAPYLVCLGIDNYWYIVSNVDVIAIDKQSLPSSQIEWLIPPDNLGIKLGKSCPGDEVSAEIAQLLAQKVGAGSPSPSPSPLPEIPEAPEVLAQKEKMVATQTQIDNHSLSNWGRPGTIIKRHNRRLSLKEEIRDRQTKYREHQTHHWQEFLNLIEVLQAFDALKGYKPTPLGKAAAAIRGDNELWLALALTSGECEPLQPQHLAAAACALISEPPRPDSWVKYNPPQQVIEVLDNLRPLGQELNKLQNRYKVALPVWREYKLIGIVEQWALGIEWVELCEHTSLDEGDIVRLLRRTVDFLSQIPHIPDISGDLKKNARRAIQLMERFPVSEIVD